MPGPATIGGPYMGAASIGGGYTEVTTIGLVTTGGEVMMVVLVIGGAANTEGVTLTGR